LNYAVEAENLPVTLPADDSNERKHDVRVLSRYKKDCGICQEWLIASYVERDNASGIRESGFMMDVQALDTRQIAE